jgi:hypothetical protein
MFTRASLALRGELRYALGMSGTRGMTNGDYAMMER